MRNFFGGRDLTFDRWEAGVPKTLERLSRLRIAKFAPGPEDEDEWVYASIGAWEFSASKAQAVEFLMVAPFETRRMAELITMVANYHRTEYLEFGHVFPIGEGWLEGSECDHFLVSLPYPFDPDFAICHVAEDFHVRFAWLLPITKAEKDFVVIHGAEELESKFETVGIEYANPSRTSVI